MSGRWHEFQIVLELKPLNMVQNWFGVGFGGSELGDDARGPHSHQREAPIRISGRFPPAQREAPIRFRIDLTESDARPLQ